MKLTKSTLIEGEVFKEGTEIRIIEGKQVGTSYHFTNFKSLIPILKSDSLIAPRNTEMEIDGRMYPYISLTRDYNLSNGPNDSMPWGDFRLSIDGDSLSNSYKIVPYLDNKFLTYDDRKNNRSESENAILTDRVSNLSKYVYQVDILEDAFFMLDANFRSELIKDTDNPRKFTHKPTGIVFQAVREFKPYKYQIA